MMTKLKFLIIFSLLSFSQLFANTELTDHLTKGKWINREDGTKVLMFKADNTFEFDSVKQVFWGKWEIINHDEQHIKLTFNNNNIACKDIVLKENIIVCGNLEFKNIPGGLAGLINFIEFSGFANAQSGNLLMIAVGLFFIFLAIRFN